jgi:peptidoglycan/LPS O-acetylase OafA/YrhL
MLGGGWSERVLTNLSNFGTAGPAAFFITSGFVLSLVWERSKNLGFANYLLRRYLRLTPLYSVVLLYFYAVSGKIDLTLQVKDLVLRILYLDAFNQNLFLTSPNDILWTISIEFWISLLIPCFVYIYQETKFGEIFLLSCLLISFGSPVVLVHFGMDISMAYKSLPSALFCFAVGSYISLQAKCREASKTYSLIFILGIGFMAMYLWSGFMDQWWVAIVLTCGYLGRQKTAFGDVSALGWGSGILLWLGTICYGVYLLHPVFLGLLSVKSGEWLFYWALLPVLAASTLSWVALEKPMSGIFRTKRTHETKG